MKPPTLRDASARALRIAGEYCLGEIEQNAIWFRQANGKGDGPWVDDPAWRVLLALVNRELRRRRRRTIPVPPPLPRRATKRGGR